MKADERDPQTYAIIGACMEVHRHLGTGFLEPVYQVAVAMGLCARGVVLECELPLTIRYKGDLLPCSYRADFICFGDVLVELKALDRLTSLERAQVLNYLKATGFRHALLVNFGSSSLHYERFVL